MEKARERLKKLTDLEDKINGLNDVQTIFLNFILEGNNNPKGRRYTTDEKVLALSIYKKSNKCYVYLAKFIRLPSETTMKQFQDKIKLISGTHSHSYLTLHFKILIDGDEN